jgi:hypothetical protein
MSGYKAFYLKAIIQLLPALACHNLLENLCGVLIEVAGIMALGKLMILCTPYPINTLATFYRWALLNILSPANHVFIDSHV